MSIEQVAATNEEIEVRGPSALFSCEGRVNRGTFWKITILNLGFRQGTDGGNKYGDAPRDISLL